MITPGGGHLSLARVTRETVILIHDHAAAVGETWDFGVRDVGSVDHFVTQIRRRAEAVEERVDLAAWAMHYIVAEHPFWDANHRTGYHMAQTILRAFGVQIGGTSAEIELGVRAIDREGLTAEDVARWIRPRLVPYP